MKHPDKTTKDTNILRSLEPHTSYLICTTPRSGSTLLCLGLESTDLGGIASGAPHELFLPVTRAEVSQKLKSLDINPYIKSIQKKFMTSNGIFGTKIMWRHFYELLIELRRRADKKDESDLKLLTSAFGNISFIYLKRLNKIDQAISISMARQSGIWHRIPELEENQRKKDKKEKNVKFQFLQIYHYENSLAVSDNCWEKFFKRNKISPLTVVYEGLVDDFENKIFEILKYLGLDVKRKDISPRAKIKKLSDSRSIEWAEKFLKMKKAFFWLKPVSFFLIRVNQLFRLYRHKKLFTKNNCNW